MFEVGREGVVWIVGGIKGGGRGKRRRGKMRRGRGSEG